MQSIIRLSTIIVNYRESVVNINIVLQYVAIGVKSEEININIGGCYE
jgi:hypothetical protein